MAELLVVQSPRTRKKSQAMRIVRTIGQAFEVCHKLGGHSRPSSEVKEDGSDRSSEDNEKRIAKNNAAGSPEKKELNTPGSSDRHKSHPPSDLNLKSPHKTPLKVASPSPSHPDNAEKNENESKLPLSQHHQMQLVRQQLEQQQHQTQVAIAQVHLLKDQLSAETAARIEAQARAHQLLLHNKDLLDHVTVLVSRVQGLEMKVHAVNPEDAESGFLGNSQVSALPEATTPRPAPVYLPDLQPSSRYLDNNDLMAAPGTFANVKATGGLDADSPDSGHKEMSSESLTYSLTNGDANGWLNPYGVSPSMTSSIESNSRNDSGASDWLAGPGRSSISPPSSSPSKSSTIKAGSTSSIDHQSNRSTTTSRSSSFNDDIYKTRSPNFYRSPSNLSPAHRKEASDKVKLISDHLDSCTHQNSSGNNNNIHNISSSNSNNNNNKSNSNSNISINSACSNRVEFKPSPSSSFESAPIALPSSTTRFVTSSSSSPLMTSSSSMVGAAPKIDPPPKFRRTSRPIERWERGSWYDGTPLEAQHSFASDSDYFSTYGANAAAVAGDIGSGSGGNSGGAVVYRNHNRNTSHSSGSSNIATAGAFRYSDSSARSSVCSENRDSVASYNALKHKLELRINDLNSAAHHQQQQQQQQHQHQQNHQQNHHQTRQPQLNHSHSHPLHQQSPQQKQQQQHHQHSRHHHHQQQRQQQQDLHHQQQQHQQQQQQQQNGKWKMRLSYPSDDNSDNSADFSGMSASPGCRDGERSDALRS